MAMTQAQILSKLNQAVEGSSGDKTQIIQGIRTHFPRGTKAFRWAQDAFKGMPPKAPGGQDKPVMLLIAALKSPTDKKFQTAFQSLEAALGGKKAATPPELRPGVQRVQTVPGSPRQRVTTGGRIEKKPPGGKAQYIKPRLPAGSSAGAKSAKKRWDDAIARGSDPIEATRRRIGATTDKEKLAGIVAMLSAITTKAGKKPTRGQIKSLAEAAEKKARVRVKPSKPKAKPSKPAKARKVKKVKSAQRVDVAKFPLLGATWNSKVSTKSPVDNFTRAALRMRSKDKLQESIALLKTVGSGAKDKERSVFQGAIKLLKDRLKAVSPRAKVPGKKPAAAIAKPTRAPSKRKAPSKPKPKKAPTKKRAAVQKAAEKMALDAALRRGLKKGEKVTVQLDLVFTEV